MGVSVIKKRLCYTIVENSKSWRALKLRYWFNRYGNFRNGWVLPVGGVALKMVAPAACTAGLFFKLTFMGTLQVRTKWNYQSWIQIFQIKFLFLVLSFWKRIALVYFLRTDWSYTFLKVKNSNQNFNLKKSFEILEIWIFMG